MNLQALKKGLFVLPLVVPAFVGAAVNFFDPTIEANIPKKLSGTGIYISTETKQLDPAVKYFEVNSALWSDAAHKDRWIILPTGTSLTYNDTTDVFDYPEGTIFVKLFSHDTIPGNVSSRIPWETRLLIKKTVGGKLWHGVTYKWNKAGTDADLVDLAAGLDTVLSVSASGSGVRYRKWHFPSQGACYRCHRQDEGTRGVLGFLPAQLKRQLTNPNKNQIDHLFDIGVFAGSNRPNAVQLSRRWRGMNEPIPTGLTPDQRFKVIDTMARAYIAANCSGCHGTKGLANGATDHAPYLNYDFYNLVPKQELGMPGNSGPRGLDLSDAIAGTSPEAGRLRMMIALDEYGIAHRSNDDNFTMKRPWFPAGGEQRYPGFVSAGYPSFSTGLYRQVVRQSPKYDSLSFRLFFTQNGDSQGWGAWIFKAPWGSQAWLDTLKGRNVSLMTVLNTQAFQGKRALDFDNESMPPLASYIPDTAALKILAEWARTYRTLVKIADSESIYVTGVNSWATARKLGGVPTFRDGMLIAPEGWTGKATMISLNGRAWNLPSAGRGRYVLPVSAPAGVYVFRIGTQVFRSSLVR